MNILGESVFFIILPSLFLLFLLSIIYQITKKKVARYLLITKIFKNTVIFLLFSGFSLTIIDFSVRMLNYQQIVNNGGKNIYNSGELEKELKGKHISEVEKSLVGYYKRIKRGVHEEYYYFYRGGMFDTVILLISYIEEKCQEVERWYGCNDNKYAFAMGVQWRWLLIILCAIIGFNMVDLLYHKLFHINLGTKRDTGRIQKLVF